MSSEAAPKKSETHRRVIWGVTIFFVACALAWAFYWLEWGQFHESTDDSYVNGNMIMVTPQVDGIITSILADNAQMVEAGQPIVDLDRHDYEIALQKAEADLGDAVRTVARMFLQVEQFKAAREARIADFIRTKLDFEHRKALVDDASVSREDYEHSETACAASFAQVMEADRALAGAFAEVENTTIPTHPKVERAKAVFKQAFLNLHRCRVLAPAKGIITQRRAQVGQWVNASDAMLSLIPVNQMWVDANFRELDLKHLRIGQPVELISEMYGRSFPFHGNVVGLNPGTGSVFSVLPPQNATGNWIKIIQRVPVRISLDPNELMKRPLVLGLTMTSHVDTHDRTGLQLPKAEPTKPIYTSDVYKSELKGADEMIEQIIADNMAQDET